MITRITGAVVFFCLIAVGIYVYVVGKPLVLDNDAQLSLAVPEEHKGVFYYASMAPNGHNVQPWKVLYNGQNGTYTLLFDSSRGLAQVDPQNREAFISLGAFLENWKQAAQAYGYTAEISILPEPGASMEVAHITLTKSGNLPADAEQRLARMLIRHTDKRAYEARALPESAINAILEINQPHLRFYPKGTPEFAWLSRNTVEAMRVQAGHEGKRLELADWMRFSNAEARQSRDGLPAEQLGLTGTLKVIFYTFYNREAAAENFAIEAVKQTEQQVHSAAGFFVVTGSSDFKGIVQAGMHFEKFWLDAVELGISIHPMSQILEEEPFASNVMGALSLDAPAQMIVRVGINSDYGKNSRIRRDVNSFTSLEE